MPAVRIAPDDPRAPDVRTLLATHLDFANEHSPPADVHALDLAGLSAPDILFFSARADGELLAIGALKRLDAHHAELKSMHTVAAARGRGIARAMVDHLLAVARERGATRVSLETGSTEAFVPARLLYERAGFTPCPPFANYTDNSFSVCMTRSLDAASSSA